MELLLVVIAAAVFLLFRRLTRGRAAAPASVDCGPVGWCARANWRVVPPLARADARRVFRHPAFIAGVFLTPWMLMAATGQEYTWRRISPQIALALVPLGWLTIVAINLVALRPRRTGADELWAALPTPQPVRSCALLATAFVPVLAATVLAVAWVVVVGTRGSDVTGSPQWADIAVGLLIVAGSVTVGVAVARWLPHALFGVLAAIATAVIQARFLNVSTWPWDRSGGDPLRFIAFVVEPSSVANAALEVRPAGWHLVYLAGLVIMMACVALARDGLQRSVGAVVGAGVLVVGVAGWMQSRPVSTARADEMVAYLTEPAPRQVCEVTASVRYCAYRGFSDDIAAWRDRVGATLALVPSAARTIRPPLQVIQRAAIIVSDSDCTPGRFEDGLPPRVAARVSPAAMWPADGHVHPPFVEESFSCEERKVNGFFLAVQTGAWAAGLPPAPHERNQRCTATGQARAAIALWAGAAATPKGLDTLRHAVDSGPPGRPMVTYDGWDDPPMWGVDYAVADAKVAMAMLALPTADVSAALDRDWARWTDPGTSSSALARELGVDGGGTAPALPGVVSCP
jgi:hypothetical protein